LIIDYEETIKMNRYLPLILLGVLLNAAAQLSLKQGMRTIGHFAFSLENILPIGTKVLINPFVLTGLLCYVISVIVWLMALSRVEVSYAYPLLSVGYIVTAFAGQFFFQEALGPVRWAGIMVICLGVFLVTRSA
jgi:multidrug transporter EmrE-like cation transporter